IQNSPSCPSPSPLRQSIRPLLQAMLQPLPADRPDMADVAGWGESAEPEAKPSRGGSARFPAAGEKSERGSSIGRIAAAVALLILAGSVGGTLYVFRDALPWNVAEAPP